jgi:hypothetical protein
MRNMRKKRTNALNGLVRVQIVLFSSKRKDSGSNKVPKNKCKSDYLTDCSGKTGVDLVRLEEAR